ncbi:hypothetical protein [Brucella sp. NBRC 12950]|uniref:hypothetical protein n=1 Tax=Brucella sp. NBRC 12950 TaxID=2994518 RepID=UPI0024A4C421|nr:hypothetical protein [Brucella sp. NBRC 12950]GLU29651.1 hypothetical protein Brsp01_48840 [Brucella sp. NBRC 12950]
MLQKFPGQHLVPFAQINDLSGFYNNGDTMLICFDADSDAAAPTVRIYDYVTPKISS